MEKAEKMSLAKEDILWGYPWKNFKTKPPSHGMREG
jgi:hypothetical protein